MQKVSYVDRVAALVPNGNILIAVDRSRRLVGVVTMFDHDNTAETECKGLKRLTEREGGEAHRERL